uniref:Glutaredoxin domain-containing protein n=1 Tax=Steinernema glaseri TaxID=37863 RepID=A0A1I8AH91_9BILA
MFKTKHFTVDKLDNFLSSFLCVRRACSVVLCSWANRRSGSSRTVYEQKRVFAALSVCGPSRANKEKVIADHILKHWSASSAICKRPSSERNITVSARSRGYCVFASSGSSNTSRDGGGHYAAPTTKQRYPMSRALLFDTSQTGGVQSRPARSPDSRRALHSLGSASCGMRRCLLLLLASFVAGDATGTKDVDDKASEQFVSKRLNDFGSPYHGSAYPGGQRPFGYQPYRQVPQQMRFNHFPTDQGAAPPMNNYGTYQSFGYENQAQSPNSFFDVIRNTVRRFDEQLAEVPYGAQEVPGNSPIQTNHGFLIENEQQSANRPFGVGTPRRMPPASYDYSGASQSGIFMSSRGYSYMGYIERQVRQYPIMIYTLVQCVPCQRAKHMLAISYPDVRSHFLEITGNEDWQRQLQVDLHQLTGAVTFPYVFVCGSYIGGSSDLIQLHQTGQLRQMVNACARKAK